MKVGKIIDRERKAQGLSYSDLAKAAGMYPGGRLTEICNGTTVNPGIYTVVRVLEALGKDLAWLQEGLAK